MYIPSFTSSLSPIPLLQFDAVLASAAILKFNKKTAAPKIERQQHSLAKNRAYRPVC